MTSPLLRRTVRLLQRGPRAWRAQRADDEEYRRYPPVIVNSFPKSGTHLLSQVVEAIPGVTDFSTFWASTPSVTLRERSLVNTLRMIERVAPGEMIRGHLFHHPACGEAIAGRNSVHFFLYRDLRDVAVSEAKYLTYMNRYHRLHRLFRSLPDDEERISLAIRGCDTTGRGFAFPDIASRFHRFRAWLDDERIHAVRYEDLMSGDRAVHIRAILNRYRVHCGREVEIETILKAAEQNICPERSHTFRQGTPGGWKEIFTDRHRSEMKTVAGDLLVELGYENDRDW